jgi:transposase InsO family protein
MRHLLKLRPLIQAHCLFQSSPISVQRSDRITHFHVCFVSLLPDPCLSVYPSRKLFFFRPLANHAPQIWACDFLQSYDLFFRTLFLFFIIDHGSRRVVHVAVTRAPRDAWVAQQIREATAFGTGPRCLICDNDDKYGVLFERAVAGVHIELPHTPFQTPKANALCERFSRLGSPRMLGPCLALQRGACPTRHRGICHLLQSQSASSRH